MTAIFLKVQQSPASAALVTQDGQADDADVPAPPVGQVVDQALVGPSVGQLGVVDEDGGTCARHGGRKAHAAAEVVGEAEDLAALVDDHLEGHTERRPVRLSPGSVCFWFGLRVATLQERVPVVSAGLGARCARLDSY